MSSCLPGGSPDSLQGQEGFSACNHEEEHADPYEASKAGHCGRSFGESV